MSDVLFGLEWFALLWLQFPRARMIVTLSDSGWLSAEVKWVSSVELGDLLADSLDYYYSRSVDGKIEGTTGLTGCY